MPRSSKVVYPPPPAAPHPALAGQRQKLKQLYRLVPELEAVVRKAEIKHLKKKIKDQGLKPPSRRVTIYALLVNGDPFYVGATCKSPKRRLSEHLAAARAGIEKGPPAILRIRAIEAAGGKVEVRTLQEKAWAEDEAKWIRQLLDEGCVLENTELLPPRYWQDRCQKGLEENQKLREEIERLKGEGSQAREKNS